MYQPTKDEFIRLSKKGNLIPVYKEVLADLETPVSSFLKIDEGKFSFLLESVEGTEKIARYSFLGTSPSFIFKSKGNVITIEEHGRKKTFTTNEDPIYEIKKFMSQFKFVEVNDAVRFCGGLVGYTSYDVVRFFEEIPNKNPDDLHIEDSVYLLTDTFLIFDHINHTIKVVANIRIKDNTNRRGLERLYNEALRKIDSLVLKLRRPVQLKRTPPKKQERLIIKSNFTKHSFEKAVLKIKDYISRGDIVQAVLSQRFELDIKNRPFDIYRALRSVNPSPYMYYLKLGGTYLVGSSPELLVRCEDGVVQTRPIAGTRPRGFSEEVDRRLEKDLLKDPKECAEHVMLVDLGRNDLGRVCEYGTVRMSDFMSIERYSHVMHIVSEVVGRLSKDKDMYDLFRTAFPAGTVSGAPKIRAMEIIDELENTQRGPYAGSIGYFSFSGNLDTCITIRTILIIKNKAYIQAGAGIVAESVPAKEYIETKNKAKALIKAIDIAQKGLGE